MNFIYHVYNDIYFINESFHKVDDITKFFPCFTWRPNKFINDDRNVYCSYFKRDGQLPSEIIKNHNIGKFKGLLISNGIKNNHENLFMSMNNFLIKKFLLNIKEHCRQLIDSGLFYDKGYDLPYKIIVEIEKNKLNLQGKLSHKDGELSFNPYTKTYRLRNDEGYFCIYNLKKELRVNVHPNNDLFIEFDYNSVEFRLLLHCVGIDTSHVSDLYEEYKHFFNVATRAESKQKYFETIYGGRYEDGTPMKELIDKFIKKVYNGAYIQTPYGARVYCDDIKNVPSYYCQTICSLMLYEQALKLVDFIKDNNLKSYLSFTYHDAIIIDVVSSEIELLKSHISQFTETRFGHIPGVFKAGLNYGDMKKFEFKNV